MAKTDVCGACGFELGAGPELRECPSCKATLAFDASALTPSDELGRRALELHEVEGKVLRILAPLDHGQRLRTLAAVLCMQSNDLSQMVVDAFMRGK